MKRVMFVMVLVLAVGPLAEALAAPASGGGSRSSSPSGGSSARSSSPGSGGSSKPSTPSGKPAAFSSPKSAKPTASKPSSGPVKQPNSVHLIPKGMVGGRVSGTAIKLPRGRNFNRDTRDLRRNPSYLDPYSPSYYGHPNSVYHYLFLAALFDDDDENPRQPQRCEDYNESDNYCEDYVGTEEDDGGCNSFAILPWIIGGGGGLAFMRLRRRRIMRWKLRRMAEASS